ncbi:MAG: MBL fold metallo-hydrolase [Actinobacteria bacterium]|nr:MBL fold metallo-hydrolase [Actinomycetota bacterium]
MKITILVDNYVSSRKLKAEHGWSAVIEDGNEKILFDCGQSDLLLDNAKVLGFDLNEITKIVLSHGHYDHTGGLLPLLKYLNRNIDIYAHPSVFEEKFSRYRGFNGFNESRYIGIPEKMQVYEKKGAKFLLSKDPVKISSSILLSGQIKKEGIIDEASGYNDEHFFIKSGDKFVNDPLLDDISIFISLPGLLLVVAGCAHSGIINILKKAGELKLIDKEMAIVGGLHLSGAGKQDIDNIIKELQKYDIRLLVPSHCTGINAFVQLRNSFEGKCIFGCSGKVLDF